MATDPGTAGAMAPVMAFALVGALGVGSQWLAWRLKMPAIVLMLAAGLLIGPVTGVFDPVRDIGPLTGPMISIAVAIILFEGGLTLNLHSLRDAALGVRRLVFVGAPLGWLTSTLALHYAAGLSWESATVFGGIMIVTGPTVIAPLLRSARLARRPAQLLQWEAIVNDPIGALAAVLAFQVVVVLRTATDAGAAALDFGLGIGVAGIVGFAAGAGLSWAYKAGRVPEFMKVPVLFALLLGTFAVSDMMLHESGLLAVTIMGIVMANSNMPSYDELRRFKEHATVLLVSGVFILLAAGLDVSALGQLTWRTAVFVGVVVLVARPVTVIVSLLGSNLPWNERWLVALTGPRGVVLVAVAGLFGTRLVELGVEDAALIGPMAFALVAATVVLHGFTLAPMGRWLGLASSETPGVLLIGGNTFTLALAEALTKAEVTVTVADRNHGHLRPARAAGLPTFSGDVLSEAAEHRLDLARFAVAVTATDNDAYNTLVATDLGHELGRDNVYQVTREKDASPRHQLPVSLGGRSFAGNVRFAELTRMVFRGWTFRIPQLSEEYDFERWRADNPEARLLGRIDKRGIVRFVNEDEGARPAPGIRLIALAPPEAEDAEEAAA